MIVVLTDGEQDGNEKISDALRREITQGLQERHGLDKGIAIAGTGKFFDFGTCEEMDLGNFFNRMRLKRCKTMADYGVRCIAC